MLLQETRSSRQQILHLLLELLDAVLYMHEVVQSLVLFLKKGIKQVERCISLQPTFNCERAHNYVLHTLGKIDLLGEL